MTPELVMAILVVAATGAIIVSFAYMLGMYLEGRASRDESVAPSQDFFVVYLIPCLNEEQVIGATLDRLQPMLNGKSLALVIDDGSDDRTATIVASRQGQNVVLLQRELPQARQGKGAALNAAVRYLLDSPILDGQSSDQVLVCLLDADGRLDPHAADVAARSLVDATVGGVQIAVRIGNREEGLLPRLQDMEFVCYTELFQRCRGLAGFAGLGGNGQFTRLSALQSLGPNRGLQPRSPKISTSGSALFSPAGAPCTGQLLRSTNKVCAACRHLIRQRSRWFQGLLQCWRLIPAVARRSAGRVRLDLLHMLLTPVLILAAALMTLSFLVGPIERVLRTDVGFDFIGINQVAAWYIMTFLPAFLLASCYRSVASVSRSRSLALAHAFVLYGLVLGCGRDHRGRAPAHGP